MELEKKRKSINLKILAFITIGIWLVIPIIFNIINIDYANNNIELLNDILWIILVSISVGVISLDSYKKQINKSKGLIGIVVAIVFTFLILLFFRLFNLCGLTFSEPIYKNKYDNSIICKRTYDCGAYDSDPSNKLVKMTNYFGIIIIYSDVNLEAIDNSVWIKQKE